MDSQQIQGRGGMKNLQWKEKPKPDTQIYINNSVNNVENFIDSKSSGMMGNVRSRPSSVSLNNFIGERSAGQAPSANVAADVSVDGKVQPAQKAVQVESSFSSVNSIDSKASIMRKIGGRSLGGTVDGVRAATSGSLNSNGRGGMKNLQWKEKPMADAQIYVNNSINNVENLIDSKSSGMMGNVRSRPSSLPLDNLIGERSAGKASSDNVTADVSVVGKVQPAQKAVQVESSFSSVDSIDSKALNLRKIGGRPSGGTVDGVRLATEGSLNSNVISGSDFGKLAARKSLSGQKSLWVAKGHATQSGINNLEQVESPLAATGESQSVAGPSSSTLKAQNSATVLNSNHTIEEEQPVKGLIGGDFARSQILATFYPKFENEKSDQEGRGGMKNLQWKEKPMADAQIYINNPVNNVENLIDSKSSGMMGNVGSTPSLDNFIGERSAGQASSANVAADVSVVGNVQPAQKVVQVESSFSR